MSPKLLPEITVCAVCAHFRSAESTCAFRRGGAPLSPSGTCLDAKPLARGALKAYTEGPRQSQLEGARDLFDWMPETERIRGGRAA
jgi:hypothetical protein